MANAGAAEAAPQNQPYFVEAYEDKIVYDIMINFPNVGLVPPDKKSCSPPRCYACTRCTCSGHPGNEAISYTILQEWIGQSTIQ
jgi:hypothetical protein